MFFDRFLRRKAKNDRKGDTAKEQKFRDKHADPATEKRERRAITHRIHKKMGGYRRTQGYRNFINRLAWLPTMHDTNIGRVAELKSGRRYLISPTGWRRIGDDVDMVDVGEQAGDTANDG